MKTYQPNMRVNNAIIMFAKLPNIESQSVSGGSGV
jgi:hypothetical protein